MGCIKNIIDMLSVPRAEKKIIRAALSYFDKNKVDLIVTNQSSDKISKALKKYGFFNGPSNFEFAASKQLTTLIKNKSIGDFHINRGDGDGPNNL